LVVIPEGKRPLGRCRSRCEDNINMNLREIRLEGMDWINLAHDKDRWPEDDTLMSMYVAIMPKS
jgi:hypothetical protein